MKFGIIGAMDIEVDLLKENMENVEVVETARMKFYDGTLSGQKATLVRSGIGKVNAALAAEIIISRFNADVIINTGCAGALDKELSIGDTVISKDAVEHDLDTSAIGFKKGEHPFMNIRFFEADENLIKRAEAAVKAIAPDVKIKLGRICTGDQFISSKEKKAELVEEFQGSCAEMEGASIAHVCYMYDAPFVIIRAISDQADDKGQMSFEEFAPIASKRSAAITKYMIESWK
ncbi:MAG: 5'-methylthioadenosine/adenosylhomocysteine nucleosidase [Selenomonadaceae bacterium]|nr:5'-methylthioadenosine/adenosylhomocysteine nucleosidase [Selenomonadaceae bacterium]